ncbi:metal cation transporter MSC2 LALA0_S12e02608g [Lachancea lanzarotensis]|uniref:Zinc transporter n=1 Tax=Lachancea lanzarotensis TaxID=1245769 RepID=A0A0C7MX92_9SACH|nr:uncharacterized protein LALA0_S12e02608g [Lachancea lanzarotensis]CEP64598.1 LALA0S12e02608g1_1 [Lachancea lanzarotensis]
MGIDDVLSRIPVILSYPTVLLSSNLIVTRSGKNASESAGFGFTELLIEQLITPLLCASAVAALGGALGTIERLNSVFGLAFVSLSLNSLLGHIQTSVLSALLLQLLCGVNSFDGLYAVLPILSLFTDYLRSTSYLKTIASYLVILMTLYLKDVKFLGLDIMRGKQLRPVHFATFSVILVAFLHIVVTDHFEILPNMDQSGLEIQYSMMFVYFGCLALLFVSWKEIWREASLTSARRVLSSNYIPPILGLAAMVLQFISSNTLPSALAADTTLLLFIVVSGVVSFKTCQYTGTDHLDNGTPLCEEQDHDSCENHNHSHSHDHAHSHGHNHTHQHNRSNSSTNGSSSDNSKLFLQLATNPETRTIFSFLLLNTAFMFVQLLYSFRSKSLGLLSDSLHMALDCLSLLLGLVAGILSKRPASDTFPFALGYLETLAGFTNGVLLIGIVSGILVEAIDRISNPTTLLETTELLVVSFLGLLVNLVGLFAFDHGGHGHDGSNENMRGIFLHIMADTLGSVGVVISTLLTKLFGSQIFDPIASIFIAVLILLSSIPLIKSTTASILLKLNDKQASNLKSALNQISMTPGITGYTTPRFWPLTSSASHGGHSHSHSHSHSESSEKSGSDHGCESENLQTLIGYIHVQYVDGENSAIIKKRVEKILSDASIKAWVQVEPKESVCWCRSFAVSDAPALP